MKSRTKIRLVVSVFIFLGICVCFPFLIQVGLWLDEWNPEGVWQITLAVWICLASLVPLGTCLFSAMWISLNGTPEWWVKLTRPEVE